MGYLGIQTKSSLETAKEQIARITSQSKPLEEKINQLKPKVNELSSLSSQREILGVKTKLLLFIVPFKVYLQQLGFSKYQQVDIQVKDMPNAISFYEQSNKLLFVAPNYTDSPDFVLHEYVHSVLLPQGYFHEDDYHDIESALALYLPCSYKNNAVFGNLNYLINLTEKRDFSGLSSQAINSVDPAVIWASAFWQIRQQLGQSLADKLLTSTWRNLKSSELQNRSGTVFVSKLLKEDQYIESGKHANQIKLIFNNRGLKVS